MKTFSALIFCISVILLMYLSSATNQGERYLQTLTPVETYEKMECLETCASKKFVMIVPGNKTVKVLARLIGETKTIARVEYQDQAGWFTLSETNAKFLTIGSSEVEASASENLESEQ